jgi:hypothetical protein
MSITAMRGLRPAATAMVLAPDDIGWRFLPFAPLFGPRPAGVKTVMDITPQGL